MKYYFSNKEQEVFFKKYDFFFNQLDFPISSFRSKIFHDYHAEILKYQGDEFKDISFLVEKEEKIVFLFSSFLKNNSIHPEQLPVVIVKENLLSPKEISLLLDFLMSYLKKNNIKKITFRNYSNTNLLSIFFQKIIKKYNYEIIDYLFSYININENFEIIKKNINKGHKSITNKSKKENFFIIDKKNFSFDDIYKAREIHFYQSKRRTRSKKSWELMGEMILNGNAFLVFEKENDIFVSYALFTHLGKNILYASSASKKNKAHMHSIILLAIEHAKKEKIAKYFVLGSFQANDAKLKNISLFKAGFTNTVCFYIDFCISIND